MIGGYDESILELEDGLFGLLDAIDRDRALEGRVALHGGTALNAFIAGAPRLSCDLDISVIGDFPAAEVPRVKGEVLGSLERIARGMGYATKLGRDQHAGRTMKLVGGTVATKIDLNLMNRVTPFEPARMRSTVDSALTFPVLSPYDVIGGKVRALFGRTRLRDLFDAGTIAGRATELDPALLHGAALLYASLSDRFPQHIADSFADDIGERFRACDEAVDEALTPFLSTSAPEPTLEGMIELAESFARDWIDPASDADRRYLSDMRRGSFQPELILPLVVAERARRFPEAIWKVRNLARYAELPRDDGAKDTLTLLAERKLDEAGMRAAGGDQGAYGRGDR